MQDDRLELKVKGFGEREESWFVPTRSTTGAPAKDDVWLEVDEVLKSRLKVKGGGTIGIDTMSANSGD
ncbi:phage terminase large subunit GpA-like protein [Massilia sp. UYP32]|uniref:terminase gpA endonuclease subunit n=1 Tax=Massilia sp. UYP32 TaxID=1756386 RepID=UPI003D23957A